MAGRRRQSESDAKSASSATKEPTLMPFLIPLLLNEAIAKPGRVWPRRGVALPNCRRAGRVTLPGGMRGAPAAGARTRQARQSAFADAKGRVAAHLRASSKRAAPLLNGDMLGKREVLKYSSRCFQCRRIPRRSKYIRRVPRTIGSPFLPPV